jgi:ABC-type transporter Mla subunit MlaD
MTTPLTPGRALETLAAQHATLRETIDRCEELADAVDDGAGAAPQLLREVARLRAAFDEHNQFEEQLLRPLLLDVDWLGAVRVSRMVEDHVEEHRAMRQGLAATPTGDLRGVLASLRDHLATEERYFLSRKVLRDDLAG